MFAKDYAKDLVNKFYSKNNKYPEKSLDYFIYKKSIDDAKEFIKEVITEIKKIDN